MHHGIIVSAKHQPTVARIIATYIFSFMMILALSACQSAEPALKYGDIYSAEAFRPVADGSLADIRGLSVGEAKEVFEYLYQAKRKKAEGGFFNPDGAIIIKLKKTVDGIEQLQEYRLTAYEEFQTWLLEIDNNGVRKVWRLDGPDGLDSIVKGIMAEGLWRPVETPVATDNLLPSAQQ